jgi:hypothetical protein
MPDVRLEQATREAARRLRTQGIGADACDGGTLRCHRAKGGHVLVRSRVEESPEFDHEFFLNRFATTLVAAAARPRT